MSSSALAAGIHLLRCKLAAQQPGEDSDEQLLHAFTSRRDERAFAALMHRHGPMVLRVCRRVLGHEQDAEDAFQATFLVLAQSAVALRNKTTLASFLHGTAYRTAMKAKQTAARRRKYERQTPVRASTDPAEELSWREAQALLDEEIDRLPETYRSVFVLCHLEGLSREETAQRLGLKEGTVSSRLTTARKRLTQQLTRRGVELAAVLAAMGLTAPSASALPVELMATTIKAALAMAAGEKLAGLVSTSVAQLVKSATAAMAVSKAKTAMVLLLTGSLLDGVGVWVSAKPYVALSPSEQPRAVQVKDKAATPLQSKAAEPLVIQSRVLDHTPWDFFGRSAMKSAQFTVRAFNPYRPRPVLFLHPEKKLVGTLEPPKDESARVTVKLMPGATVTGRLVDKDGQPRGGAELDLYFEQKSGSFAHYFPERITTDADGRFRIDTLLTGYNFQLREAKGYFTFGGLRSGETNDLGDVQTQRSGE